MLRPVSLLLALVAATLGGLLVAEGPASATTPVRAAAAAEDTAPLTISLDRLAPSTMPVRGKVRISGSVTNVDDEAWTTINLYPFVSTSPLTTSAELEEAAGSDEQDFVGARITDPGPYAVIDQLGPGETAQFSIAVPRARIAAASPGVEARSPGVYWFGVHALGQSADGRDDAADGRARTFLPLVPPRTRGHVDTALVVPVRHAVRHRSDGRIDDLPEWTATLSPGGRLYALAELGTAARGRPLTWIVDPAVVDAVRRLAAGNPARSLAPTLEPGQPDPDTDPSPSTSSSTAPGSPSASGSESDGAGRRKKDEKPDEATQAAADAAAVWLERMHTALQSGQILVLPYGDTDMAAAAVHDPGAYRTARERSGTVLQPWGLPATPVVSSPTGFLTADAIRLAAKDATIIASDAAFGTTVPTVARAAGRDVVVTTSAPATGGPGPDERLAPVALRQRLLSDAAVRLVGRRADPLVVQLPRSFTPATATEFFAGLDVPWLRLSRVQTVAASTAGTVSVDELVYPAAERQHQLTAPVFAAADELTRAGTTLQNLLTLNDQVGSTIRDEALTGVGYADRADPTGSRLAAERSRDWVEEHLRAVTVEAPRAVILSSGSGRFSAAITNGLDQPVTVRLAATADPPLRVAPASRTYEVAAGARASVLMNASTSGLGVRTVHLQLTDTDGAPTGSSDSLSMRSNRVSNIIWLILGIGIALLFGAIAVRLARRVSAARRL